MELTRLTASTPTAHARRAPKTESTQHRDQVSLNEPDKEERGLMKRLASLGKVFQSRGPAVKRASDQDGLKLAAPIAGFLLACAAAAISSRRND